MYDMLDICGTFGTFKITTGYNFNSLQGYG